MNIEMITIHLPEWFLKKHNLVRKEMSLDGWILRETNKAIYFRVHPVIYAFHNHYGNGKIWIPKSIITKTTKMRQTKL